MVSDKIFNLDRYLCLHPDFVKVKEVIEKFSDPALEPGKYQIDGDRVFAVVQGYDTKEAQPHKFENHRKYIDIQYIVDGCEQIHVKEMTGLCVDFPFDEPHDYEFYKTPASFVTCELEAGEFAIFWPGESHRPGVMTQKGAAALRKVIFKVQADV
ncbi:MAG: YhcH/YjgK/YiaL family protein [Clostridia bacterium]|nr:YhcH/YjgK/YiaL family protein [Clostridia bacterium]